MSLDDKFNPNDGSLIDSIDSALLKFNRKIAKTFQDTTGKNKSDLERTLYVASSSTFVSAMYCEPKFMLTIPLAILQLLKAADQSQRPKSFKHQELECEIVGMPSKMQKYTRLVCYGIGAGNLIAGICELTAAVTTGDPSWYFSAGRELSFGMANLAWTTADYMSASDIGEPPKKKPVMERIKDTMNLLLPKPAPVPATAYSALDNYVLSTEK